MGKVRTRIIGLEDVEEAQKKEQKRKALEKKTEKRTKEQEVPPQEEKPQETPKEAKEKEKPAKTRKTKARVRGKSYQKAKGLIQKDKRYSFSEAIELLKKIKYAKFDETVELHMNLVKAGLRGEVQLPHATGKQTRAVVATDAVLDDIEKGKIDFDVLITHPSYMPRLARFAKVLGPRGLMPSPKTGTISDKPEQVLEKFKGGFIRWKSEAKFPILHQGIGKISSDEKVLLENATSFIDAIGKNNIQAVFVKTTMSPSIKINIS